jgi:hypothetical protein
MKSLDELEKIANTYSGGPILSFAAKDLVKWAKAYREVAIEMNSLVDPEQTKTLEYYAPEVDDEARRIAEKMK